MSDRNSKREKLIAEIDEAGLVEETSVGDIRTRLGSLKTRYQILKEEEREEGRENGSRPLFNRIMTDKLV